MVDEVDFERLAHLWLSLMYLTSNGSPYRPPYKLALPMWASITSATLATSSQRRGDFYRGIPVLNTIALPTVIVITIDCKPAYSMIWVQRFDPAVSRTSIYFGQLCNTNRASKKKGSCGDLGIPPCYSQKNMRYGPILGDGPPSSFPFSHVMWRAAVCVKSVLTMPRW